MARKVALGFSARTGWAAMVTVGEEGTGVVVLGRARLELVSAGLPRQIFHAVRDLPRAAGERLVRDVEEAAQAAATSAIEETVGELGRTGYSATAAGIVMASGSLPSSLETILASHALVHAAEGELYRGAIIGAAETCGLSVTAVPLRKLYPHAARALALSEEAMRSKLTALGATVGRPWRREHKEAALIAWLALLRR